MQNADAATQQEIRMTATFAEAQDVLAAKLPGYTRRPHQMALAEQVEQAMADGRPILGQAGCGTGKSLAALIPVIQNGERTVVATATKALQDQYRGDLDFLLENLGIDFRYAVLKGRSNYPCALKISELENPNYAQTGVLEVMKDLDLDDPDVIVDREGLPSTSDADWRGLSMTTTECPGKKACPFGNVCMTERAKDKAGRASVVVTNTTYLLLDLILRKQSDGTVALLGDFEHLLIDEAHELFDKATDALSDSMGETAFQFLARDIEAFLHDQHRDISSVQVIRDAASVLWARFQRTFATVNEGSRKEDPVKMGLSALLAVGPQIEALIDAIGDAREAVVNVRGLDPMEREGIARGKLMRRTAEWGSRLARILISETDVRWLEMETRLYRGEQQKNLMLRTAPLTPAPFLRENIWNRTQATLMSATLVTGNNPASKFDFVRDQLGFRRDEAIEFDAGTPFDFQNQAMLYVPAKGSPEPSGATAAAWKIQAQQQMKMLTEAAGGNALLLFTSRVAMNDAYAALAEGFIEKGIRVMKQGDAPTPEMIRAIKEGGTVIFGLRTFFVGIDIQGDALKFVGIDKLPFAVPTDVLHSERCEVIKKAAGGNTWAPFAKLTIPEMSLVLIQGFGRLIRHANDKGVVAIFDPRLKSKSYGKTILGSLPPAPQTDDIRKAMAFLRES
jgi:ATP-dependent DNA helicase DinG